MSSSHIVLIRFLVDVNWGFTYPSHYLAFIGNALTESFQSCFPMNIFWCNLWPLSCTRRWNPGYWIKIFTTVLIPSPTMWFAFYSLARGSNNFRSSSDCTVDRVVHSSLVFYEISSSWLIKGILFPWLCKSWILLGMSFVKATVLHKKY